MSRRAGKLTNDMEQERSLFDIQMMIRSGWRGLDYSFFGGGHLDRWGK